MHKLHGVYYYYTRSFLQNYLVNKIHALGPRPSYFTRFFYHIDYPSVIPGFQPNVISMVRDPIKRFVSFYDYIRRKDAPWSHSLFEQYFAQNWDSFEDYCALDINDCVLQDRPECGVGGGEFQIKFLAVVMLSLIHI